MVRLIAAIISIVIYINSCYAEITIEISQKNPKLPCVLVDQFLWEGDKILPENLEKIIETDIELSGRFKIYDSSKYFAGSSQDSKQQNYNYPLFHGISFKLSGQVVLKDNKYQVEYKLHDILKQKCVLEGCLEGDLNSLRAVAHKISDNIFYKITGVEGDFSTKILYVKHIIENNISTYQLCCADSDGARPTVVLKSNEPIMSPCWSPDGLKIAYVSFEQKKSNVYIHDLSSGKRVLVLNSKGIQSSPTWSPDSKSIALVASNGNDPNIYVLDLDTKKLSQITFGVAINTEPCWLANSRSILFTSGRKNGVQIFQVDIKKNMDGTFSKKGNCKQITKIGVYNARAKIFPDGKSIAIVHKYNANDQFSIATFNLSTERMKILSTSRYEDAPSISANGQRMLFSTAYKDTEILQMMTTKGDLKINLPLGKGSIREPAWGPKKIH